MTTLTERRRFLLTIITTALALTMLGIALARLNIAAVLFSADWHCSATRETAQPDDFLDGPPFRSKVVCAQWSRR